MTALENNGGGDLVPFKGKMIARQDIPTSSRVKPVAVQSMDDALRYAKVIAASGMLPKSFAEAGDPIAAAFVCIQLGAEVGLTPMASVQNIALINGRPGLFGPAMLAVCEASGMLETFEEWIEGDGDTLTAYCKVKRSGRAEKTISFSWADARKAGLTEKKGPWKEYPKRMMQARARTFALRDVLPDVLLGLAYSVEELQDINRDPPRRSGAVEYVPDSEPMPAAAGPIPTTTVEAPGYAGKKAPLLVKLLGDAPPAEFARNGKGLSEAIDFMGSAVLDGAPEVVELNAALLDWIVGKYPDYADDIAELRAAAVMAAGGPGDDASPDADGGPADTFVSDFVNGDADGDFPGDMPPRPDSPS